MSSFSEKIANIDGNRFRKKMLVPKELAKSNFEIKIAETKDEFESAFNILYKVYLETGLTNKTKSEIRCTPYHLQIGSTVIILKVDNKVVATMGLLVDDIIGIPADHVTNLDFLRKQSLKIGEITSLAILSEFRTNKEIFLYLSQYIFNYAIRFSHCDCLVIVAHPKHMMHHVLALGFEIIDSSYVKNYSFVNNAEAISAYLDLSTCYERQKQFYQSLPEKNNLHSFMYHKIENKVKLPMRLAYDKNFDSPMTPEMADYFLAKDDQLKRSIEPGKLKIILDSLSKKRNIFKDQKCLRKYSSSDIIIEYDNIILKGVILDISNSGFQAFIENPEIFNNGLLHPVTIEICASKGIKFKASPVWQKDNRIGFKLINPDAKWWKMVALAEIVDLKHSA